MGQFIITQLSICIRDYAECTKQCARHTGPAALLLTIQFRMLRCVAGWLVPEFSMVRCALCLHIQGPSMATFMNGPIHELLPHRFPTEKEAGPLSKTLSFLRRPAIPKNSITTNNMLHRHYYLELNCTSFVPNFFGTLLFCLPASDYVKYLRCWPWSDYVFSDQRANIFWLLQTPHVSSAVG